MDPPLYAAYIVMTQGGLTLAHSDTTPTIELVTDVLVIGGGTAGCLAAVAAKETRPDLRVTIMEKAAIERSGCLAAGMNAINAYLHPGRRRRVLPVSCAMMPAASSVRIWC